jgi:hypothetical protein
MISKKEKNKSPSTGLFVVLKNKNKINVRLFKKLGSVF